VTCGDGPTVKGIDVSYYETSIDWDAVHEAGVELAFIRASDGLQFPDPKFAGYWAGARAAGVIRGAYQYFRPAQDPIAQADLLLERMGPLQPGDLPPVLDVEDRNSGLTPPQIAAAVRAWVDHVTPKLGRPPIIYAGLYSWPELTGSADQTASPLWVAQYTSAPCPNIPAPWTRWMFWQTSATGSVPGIPGANLDLNVYNGTLDDLRAFTQPGSCGDNVCSGDETPTTCERDCAPCGTIDSDGGVIDDGDACFLTGGPARYLRQITSVGDGGDLIWTYATAADDELSFGQWNLHFEAAGRYRVEAYTAHAYAGSTRAAYEVSARGASTMVTLDQTAVDGWQPLGDFDFAAGGNQSIHLGDNTGESSADKRQLVFDAVRLTRIHADQPAPPPDPAPDDLGPGEPALGAVHAGGCAATSSSTGGLVLGFVPLIRRRRRRAVAPPARA